MEESNKLSVLQTNLSIENEELKTFRQTSIEAHSQELQIVKEKFEADMVCVSDTYSISVSS